jgi:hypothetical protein
MLGMLSKEQVSTSNAMLCGQLEIWSVINFSLCCSDNNFINYS